MAKYLLSNFSLNMVESDHYKPDIRCISEEEFLEEKQDAIPIMGNPAFARMFKVPCMKSFIQLKKGDVALVVSTDKGKLPFNATCLPEGWNFNYKRVEIVEAEV